MTVYVESNFVIEIALGQEQHQAAESLLAMAENGAIALACPVIALAEPFTTATQRGRVRRRLNSQLDEQIRELARSQPHQEEVATLQPVPTMLAGIERKEVDLLVATVDRLVRAGRILGIDSAVFGQAVTYRDRFELSVQDAIVLAAVGSDLSRSAADQQSFFASKNWKDFGRPGIQSELRSFNCLFVEDFRRLQSLISD